MPTTLGSLMFKDYMPRRDAFVAAKLRTAGVVFLGKVTLGELGGGDTHGSLFGSTRRRQRTIRDLPRRHGFATVRKGLEKRPSALDQCGHPRAAPCVHGGAGATHDQLLKVMADHRLDAIVHKAVEHQPTLIKDGIAPPFVDQKGAPHIDTFLIFVPPIVMPAGFTKDYLPAGVTFSADPTTTPG